MEGQGSATDRATVSSLNLSNLMLCICNSNSKIRKISSSLSKLNGSMDRLGDGLAGQELASTVEPSQMTTSAPPGPVLH